MTVNLLPLWRNDGYFILEAMSGIRNLMRRAEASVVTLLHPSAPLEGPRWLPLFGILHIHALAALYTVLGVAAGRVADQPALGAAFDVTPNAIPVDLSQRCG